MKTKVLFCWSGGKDSAMALHRVLTSNTYEVVALLTTFNEHFQRVSMHGIREELLVEQAAATGLPLEKMYVSRHSSNEEYADRMTAILQKYKSRGVDQVAFGDIFLEDLRCWRESNLEKVGMKGLFPLWKNDTHALIREFIDLGFKSRICCVNDAYLGEEALGRDLDIAFIRDLPPNVDPCGENGEFHSFAYAGPIFKSPLVLQTGERVYRPLETEVDSTTCPLPPDPSRPRSRGFWFGDLTLVRECEPCAVS